MAARRENREPTEVVVVGEGEEEGLGEEEDEEEEESLEREERMVTLDVFRKKPRAAA